MIFLICVLILAAVLYSLLINRILGLPPGPPPLPFIGNMLSFSWEMDRKFLEWKEKYGTIFTVWMPFPIVVFGDKKVLHEHVIKNGDVYLAKKNPEQLMELMCGGLYGLVFEDNSVVKEQRRFALRALHDVGFGSSHLEDTVHSYAEEVIARWKAQDGQKIDVSDYIMCATGNIIWNITFGINLPFDDPLLPRFKEIQLEMLPLMAGPYLQFIELFPFLKNFDFFFGNHLRKLHKLNDDSNEFIREAIETIKKNSSTDDLAGSYVEAFLAEVRRREDNGQDRGSFSESQLFFSASSIWGAGFDTTVTVLRMCIHYLIEHPAVQRKIHAELDEKIGTRRIKFEDNKILPYCNAYMQEVYRLANALPLNFMRKVQQDTVVEGWTLRAGTTVLPQFSMVHLDPKEFERPEYFCPERHLNEKGEFVKDARITPFSVGKRSCLGEGLARMELFVMLLSFVQHLSFESPTVVPAEMVCVPGFTRTPKPFEVIVRARN